MKSLICAAKRTPIGSFLGNLSSLSTPTLGSAALKATLSQAGLAPDRIDEVYMGCVLSAGLGQAPARQASLGAGVSRSVPCTTVSKVCGSGLKAVMLADLSVRTGTAQAVLAGGMESMSNAPYLLPKLRTGLRMGHGELVDSMIKDGLWDVYNNYHMGMAAELLNREHKISREAQDSYAVQSYTRALRAIESSWFDEEMAPVSIDSKKGPQSIAKDEEPFRSDLSKMATLKPVFDKAGSVTAGNASSLNDGAAALLICSEEFAKKEGLKPLAMILGHSQAAQDPEWFTTAPAASIKSLLKLIGLNNKTIDLWEINEAFSNVALANMRLLELDPAHVNIRGGAVALGHPIGASGARILTTLLYALKQEKKKYGVASLCIGGGEAVSLAVENLCL